MLDEFIPLEPHSQDFPLRELERAIEALIEFRDAFDGHGEPLEDDDPAEDGGDELDGAWVERTDQSTASLPLSVNMSWLTGIPEDVEDDDGGGDCTDDEPGFDPASRRHANALGCHAWGGGAGCALNGDRELNGDEGDYGGEVDGI